MTEAAACEQGLEGRTSSGLKAAVAEGDEEESREVRDGWTREDPANSVDCGVSGDGEVVRQWEARLGGLVTKSSVRRKREACG